MKRLFSAAAAFFRIPDGMDPSLNPKAAFSSRLASTTNRRKLLNNVFHPRVSRADRV
tara:strand:+ start:288 stop:458 length:171 start_codon:yes stop_codon:yes gene_type:complete